MESKYFKTEIKPRGPRTSKSQYETYVKFLEDNPKFAQNIICEAYSAANRDSDWVRLGDLLNDCQGANKTIKAWQECLYDWRKKLSIRQRRSSMNKSSLVDPNAKQELSEVDIRALKALGKWTDEDTYNMNPQLHYDCNASNFEDEGEEYSNQSESYSMFESNPKAEPLEEALDETLDEPLEDPIVVYPERRENCKKRKLQEDYEETSKHSKIIEDNTKAIRGHTAAIMTLSDAITSLTSTMRSYMYSKSSD